jgi:hypothetical protein
MQAGGRPGGGSAQRSEPVDCLGAQHRQGVAVAETDRRVGAPERHEDDAHRRLPGQSAEAGEQRLGWLEPVGHPGLGGQGASEQRRQRRPALPLPGPEASARHRPGRVRLPPGVSRSGSTAAPSVARVVVAAARLPKRCWVTAGQSPQ